MTPRLRLSHRPGLLLLAMAMSVLGFGLVSAGAQPALDDPPPSGTPSTDSCTHMPSTKPPVVSTQPTASLTPGTGHLTLNPGQSATVPVSIVQPAQELDAFFLEDNGTKSEFTHCAFQGGLLWATSRLAKERNVRVGLGNFGDYTGFELLPSGSTGFDEAQGSSGVYYLDSPIQRPGRDFFTDVMYLGSAWRGTWHATSGDQAALEAVYQAATGAGHVIAPGDVDNIPAGAGADFRDGAFRVAVVLAGQWFDTPTRTRGYPGASFATAEAALRDHGVNVAGVWLDNENNKEANGGAQYDGFADLRTLVTDTGSRTSTSLNCGPHRPAVPAGGLPLCVFLAPGDGDPEGGNSAAPSQLGPMMRNLVESFGNPQPVSMQVLGGTKVVTRVVGAARRGVNILLPHVFDAAVTVRCDGHAIGHTVPVQLGEVVAGQPRAASTFTVTCRKPPRHAPPPVADSVIAIFGPADPPAKALLITHAPPNPAPAPQIQPQPLAQQVPQGAVAAGLSEQPDLVAQTASVSGRTPDADRLWFGLMAMSALGAGAVRWRSSHCTVLLRETVGRGS